MYLRPSMMLRRPSLVCSSDDASSLPVLASCQRHSRMLKTRVVELVISLREPLEASRNLSSRVDLQSRQKEGCVKKHSQRSSPAPADWSSRSLPGRPTHTILTIEAVEGHPARSP